MSRELDAKVSLILNGPWPEDRCRVCGWVTVPEGEVGCWKSNCSQRPGPSRRADEPKDYSTSADGLLAMLEFHAKAGRDTTLRVMPDGCFAQIALVKYGPIVHGAGAATPGEALALATVAWSESRKGE